MKALIVRIMFEAIFNEILNAATKAVKRTSNPIDDNFVNALKESKRDLKKIIENKV